MPNSFKLFVGTSIYFVHGAHGGGVEELDAYLRDTQSDRLTHRGRYKVALQLQIF